MKIARLLIALVGVAALAGPAGDISARAAKRSVGSGQAVVYSVPFGGATRTYRVYLPSGYDAALSYPLMIVYHGKGGTSAGIERKTGFDAVADANAFLLAYPDGQNGNWVLTGTNNDVNFTKALIQSIKANYLVDPTRIYASGFSEGANLVGVLGCALTDTIAGIGEVAGAINAVVARRCIPSRPIAAILFHGTADPIMPYDGGTTRSGNTVYSAEQTAGFWAGVNGCPASHTVYVPDTLSDGSQVTDPVETWSPCTAGTSVTFYTIQNGGHTWPGSPVQWSVSDGLVSTGINASMLIWQTLSPMQLPNPS